MNWRCLGWLTLSVSLGCELAAAADAATTPPVPLLLRGHLFELELAVTPEAREHGLMERAEIPSGGGMLFVFPDTAVRRFWMKNVWVDLDIVFLDGSGRVVSTAVMRAERARTERETDEQYEDRLPLYSSAAPARFAIEFSGGTLAGLALEPGERVDLDVLGLAAMAR